jgi:outer membrane lipoprotein LolB
MKTWPLLLGLAAGAQGCAHLQVGTDGLSFDERRARLETIDTLAVRGRLAVDTGDRAFQGSFDWRESGEELTLVVRGPLGGGIMEINGTADALELTARGETQVLIDPEEQLSAIVGWWLPVGSLHSWLLGTPDPGFPAQTEPRSDGTLAWLEQRLWRVDFVSYQLLGEDGTGPSILVPRRIDLAHGDLSLRVTLDRWRTDAALNSAMGGEHNTARKSAFIDSARDPWGVAKR